MNYYLRTQSEVLSELAFRMRDTDNERWTQEEMYIAVNAAIRRWSPRVLIPYIYTLPSGWSSESYTVALPDYIDPRFMRPQIETNATRDGIEISVGTLTTYVDVVGYEVESDGAGSNTLRVLSVPYSADGRILFWAAPAQLPGSMPGESAVVDTDSTTSMTITTTASNMPLCGFIKVNNEWIQYAGMTDSGPAVTVSNLVRGVYGTTTATHNNSDTVEWGVSADRLDLYENLYNQSGALMNQMYLTNASSTEREHHQWNMRYMQQAADEYWQNYSSAYQPKLLIDTRNAMTGLE